MSLEDTTTWLANKVKACGDDEMERMRYECIAIALYDREWRIRQLTFIKHTLEELMNDREWGECAICKFCDGHPRNKNGKCMEYPADCLWFDALRAWARETIKEMEARA